MCFGAEPSLSDENLYVPVENFFRYCRKQITRSKHWRYNLKTCEWIYNIFNQQIAGNGRKRARGPIYKSKRKTNKKAETTKRDISSYTISVAVQLCLQKTCLSVGSSIFSRAIQTSVLETNEMVYKLIAACNRVIWNFWDLLIFIPTRTLT